MKHYPQIEYSEVYQDWEVEVSPGLTICIDAQEFPHASEAASQALIWKFYSESAGAK
jgi:hypothetical protein